MVASVLPTGSTVTQRAHPAPRAQGAKSAAYLEGTQATSNAAIGDAGAFERHRNYGRGHLEAGPVLLGGRLLQGVLEARLCGRGWRVVERPLAFEIAGGPQHVVEALAGRPVDPDPDGRQHLRLLVAQALVAVDLRQDRLGPPEERIVAIHAVILCGAHNGGMDTTGQIALQLPEGTVAIHSLSRVADEAGIDLSTLPHTVKILLENLLRRRGSRDVSPDDVAALACWPTHTRGARVAFVPSRVLMQDFTGVPAVVDLAALRSAVAAAGGD